METFKYGICTGVSGSFLKFPERPRFTGNSPDRYITRLFTYYFHIIIKSYLFYMLLINN